MGLLSLSVTSCLKENPVNDYTNLQPVVIIPNANWPKASVTTATSLTFGKTYTSALYARVSWEFPLSNDVAVTFKEDAGAISEYNAKFGASLQALNTDAYKITSYKITIPGGQNNANTAFEIYPDKIDFFKDYALSVSITDASGQTIGNNYKTYLIPVTAKNTYDGIYTLKGKVVHPTNVAYTGAIDSLEMPLRTGSVNTNVYLTAHPWAKGSGANFTVGYEPVFTVNQTTNDVTITAPKVTGATVLNDPAFTSKYVPASKTIYAYWKYSIAGGDVYVSDTLTYKKAR